MTVRTGIVILAALSLVVAACATKDSVEHAEYGEERGDRLGTQPDEAKHEDASGTVELRPEAARRTEIVTTKANTQRLAPEIQTTGQIGFNENRVAHVSPLVEGRVHSVAGRLGQMVKANEAVAEINSMELGRGKAAYLRAKAIRDVALATYEREKSLAESKISSESEMLDARSQYLQARADFNTAKQALRLFGLGRRSVEETSDNDSKALFRVRAPIAGKIVEKHITLGELVTPATKLFTVADLTSVWIWIDIHERDIGQVHLEDVAYVTPDSYPGQEFQGRLTYIMDTVDVDTRTVRARIELANPEGLLRPGMFVRVRLSDPHGEDPRAEALATLVIPSEALLREGDGDSIVFVKANENHYERRKVNVGRRAGDLVEILAGVETGEEVVVVGGFLLKSEVSKSEMGGGHSH